MGILIDTVRIANFRAIKNLEVKFHGSKILLEAKDQLQRMQNDIKCFNIISITGSIKDS